MRVSRVRPAVAPHPGSRLETLWTIVKPDGKRRLIFGTVYRPPRRAVADLSEDFADLEAQYQCLLADFPGVKIVMCGDFNCDLLKTDCGNSKSRLCNFLSDFSLQQFVAFFEALLLLAPYWIF